MLPINLLRTARGGRQVLTKDLDGKITGIREAELRGRQASSLPDNRVYGSSSEQRETLEFNEEFYQSLLAARGKEETAFLCYAAKLPADWHLSPKPITGRRIQKIFAKIDELDEPRNAIARLSIGTYIEMAAQNGAPGIHPTIVYDLFYYDYGDRGARFHLAEINQPMFQRCLQNAIKTDQQFAAKDTVQPASTAESAITAFWAEKSRNYPRIMLMLSWALPRELTALIGDWLAKLPGISEANTA